MQEEELIGGMGGSVPRKPRRKGPLLVAKALDRLPSIERPGKNSSDLGMKLPDIKSRHYRRDDA